MPSTPQEQLFPATDEDTGKRLDQFLVSHIPDVSRTRVQQLIDQERVLVDGEHERASFKLRGGETVTVTGPAQPPPLRAKPENIPLDVVYEDDSLAVVNKPAGMMVHAGAGQSADEEDDHDPRTHGTLVNALLYRFKKLSGEGGELRPGIVHRLDKDTSGLIVVAKSDSAHRRLAEQFSSRQVRKTYTALVHGWPKAATGTVSLAIGRDKSRRNRMSVKGNQGRDAVSHYKVLEQLNTAFGKFALLDVTIETGRTHQIRVHLASLGHPIVGDTLYGAPTQLTPLSSAYYRAKPVHTKATRDRMVSELARKLTEEASGDVKQTKAKKTGKLPAAAVALEPIALDRNFLHARALEFTHPKSAKTLSFSSGLPQELDGFLTRLRHLSP
ncbi:MAG TPA: RluA family pseudouridine synthase [Terriglobales bacterium]|nr:RluA family pseudouridine synthase [Terriglobales bacterium]